MSFVMGKDQSQFKKMYQESLMLKKVFKNNFLLIYLESILGIDFGKICSRFNKNEDKTTMEYFNQEKAQIQEAACITSLYIKIMSL